MQNCSLPPAYSASFLNKFLVNQDDHSWAARDKSGGVQALFWDLTDPRGKDPSDDWDFFRNVLVPKSKGLVMLKLRDLKPGPYHLSISRVGYEKNDAYTAYLKMGHPGQISPMQVAALKAQATGTPDEERDVTVDATGTWQASFPIHEEDVILVRLRPGGRPN